MIFNSISNSQSVCGAVFLSAIVLTGAGCKSAESADPIAGFAASLSPAKSEIEAGESITIVVEAKRPPNGLLYKWRATVGQCNPQESDKPQTMYKAPEYLPNDKDITVTVKVEFFLKGMLRGERTVNITVKRNKMLIAQASPPPATPTEKGNVQRPAKKTAPDSDPSTPAAPEGSKSGAPDYPTIENPQRLTRIDVRRLAEYYGLFREWKVNPHLRFKDGDIAYWYEQRRSEDDLKLEFESRRIVLERAEKAGDFIETHGDLSYWAEREQPRLKSQRRQTRP